MARSTDTFVQAINTGCAQLSTGEIVYFAAGSRHRSSDPIVKLNQSFFAPADLTDAEFGEARRKLHREHYELPAGIVEQFVRKTKERRLRDEDAVVAKRPIPGTGIRFSKADPRVKDHPQDFVPVMGAGLKRQDALVASVAMTHEDGLGNKRTVYEGQFVAKDDPMVALHPILFTLPHPIDPREEG